MRRNNVSATCVRRPMNRPLLLQRHEYLSNVLNCFNHFDILADEPTMTTLSTTTDTATPMVPAMPRSTGTIHSPGTRVPRRQRGTTNPSTTLSVAQFTSPWSTSLTTAINPPPRSSAKKTEGRPERSHYTDHVLIKRCLYARSITERARARGRTSVRSRCLPCSQPCLEMRSFSTSASSRLRRAQRSYRKSLRQGATIL